jgi:hypothetical protein
MGKWKQRSKRVNRINGKFRKEVIRLSKQLDKYCLSNNNFIAEVEKYKSLLDYAEQTNEELKAELIAAKVKGFDMHDNL